jgi:hypothetical protein
MAVVTETRDLRSGTTIGFDDDDTTVNFHNERMTLAPKSASLIPRVLRALLSHMCLLA